METEPQHHQTALQRSPAQELALWVFTAKPEAWALPCQDLYGPKTKQQLQGCGTAKFPRDKPTFPRLRPSCPPPQRRGCSLQSWQHWQILLDLTE